MLIIQIYRFGKWEEIGCFGQSCHLRIAQVLSGLRIWLPESWKTHTSFWHNFFVFKCWFFDEILKNWSKCGCGLLEGWVKCWRLWAISETSANPLFVMLITTENLMNENKRTYFYRKNTGASSKANTTGLEPAITY